MSFAYRKFKELDKDSTDSLSADEMLELAKWVYTSFQKDGDRLNDMQAEEEARKLMAKLDKDGDDQISFDEFVEFFETKVLQAKKFHNKMVSVNCTTSSNLLNAGEVTGMEVCLKPDMPALSEAYRKFQELDSDKSGTLTSEELAELAKWVYTSFNAEGRTLPQAEVDREAGRLMLKLDADKNGSVTFDEFVGFYETRMKQAACIAKALARKRRA